jgi:hypothetical protein
METVTPFPEKAYFFLGNGESIHLRIPRRRTQFCTHTTQWPQARLRKCCIRLWGGGGVYHPPYHFISMSANTLFMFIGKYV